MICWSSFPPSVSSLARHISICNLPEMSPRWTRPQSLALGMSRRWRNKCSGTTGSLEWLATRPVDVVVHARKTFWSTLTPNKVTWLWLTRKHTHTHTHTHTFILQIKNQESLATSYLFEGVFRMLSLFKIKLTISCTTTATLHHLFERHQKCSKHKFLAG